MVPSRTGNTFQIPAGMSSGSKSLRGSPSGAFAETVLTRPSFSSQDSSTVIPPRVFPVHAPIRQEVAAYSGSIPLPRRKVPSACRSVLLHGTE